MIANRFWVRGLTSATTIGRSGQTDGKKRNISPRRIGATIGGLGLLLVVGIGVLSGSAAAVDVTGCQEINASGTYDLQNDITLNTTGSCLEVTGDDVVLDGHGHTVEGVDRNGTGIFVNATANLTVRNVTVSNWNTGIRVDGAQDSVVANLTVSNNGLGFYTPSFGVTVQNNTIQDSIARDNGGEGFAFAGTGNSVTNVSAFNNTGHGVSIDGTGGSYSDITAINNEGEGINAPFASAVQLSGATVENNTRHGLYIEGGANHYVEAVTARDNDFTGITVDGGDTTTISNVTVVDNGWSGIELIDFGDGQLNGLIVDNVYAADNGDFLDDGVLVYSAQSPVLTNLTLENSSNGLTVSNTNGASVSNVDATNNGEGVIIQSSSDTSLNTLALSGGGIGIRDVNSDLTTVTNADIQDVSVSGLSLGSPGATVESIDITNTSTGLSLTSQGVQVANVTATDIGDTGVRFSDQATNNTLTNLTLQSVPGTGVTFRDGVTDNEIRESTVQNAGVGVELMEAAKRNGLTNLSITGTATAVQTTNATDNIFEQLDLGSVTVSVAPEDVSLASATPATQPPNVTAVGGQFEVTTYGPNPLLNPLEVHYADAALTPPNESTLDLWRLSGAWSSSGDEPYAAGVNAGENAVLATNVTQNGTYGVYGSDTGSNTSGTLTGSVTGDGGAYDIVGADVIATNIDTGIGSATQTAGTGNFSLSLPAGTYDLSVSADGHRDTTVSNVTVADNGTTSRSIDLTPDPQPGELTVIVQSENGQSFLDTGVVISDEESAEQWLSQSGDTQQLPPGTYTLNIDSTSGGEGGPLYAGTIVSNVTIAANESRDVTVNLSEAPAFDASFAVSKTAVNVSETITLDASNASSPNGAIMDYAWDLDGDGTMDVTGSPVVQQTYNTQGTYDVRLEVIDEMGMVGAATETITVQSTGGGGTPSVSAGGSYEPPADHIDVIAEYQGESVWHINESDIAADTDVNVTMGRNVSEDWPVHFTDINFTTTEEVNLSMELVTADSPPTPDAETFERDDGTEHLLYHELLHEIPDEAVDSVTFEFVVSESALESDEEPGDLALYRLEDGEWVELNTTFDAEVDGNLSYTATSPGLSQFATGVKQAQFVIRDAMVSVSELQVGDSTEITVQIDNTGGAAGTFTAELLIDGELDEERDLTIAEGGTRQTTFDRTFEEPGTYEVIVNDFSSGEVSVADPDPSGDTDTSTDDESEPEESEEDGGIGLVAIGVVAVLAIAGAGAYVLYSRQEE